MTDFGTETMTRGEWWDESAPYGANGYQYGRGEVVGMTGVWVSREVIFPMASGDPHCVARGVAELTDGRVYQLTVLRPEYARECGGRERTRFASLSWLGFAETAHSLLKWEEDGARITSYDAAQHRRKIDKL